MKSIKCSRSYRRSCLFAVALFAAAAANATTYYWRGSEADDPLVPGNYRDGTAASSAVLTELPAPGDIVQVLNGGYAIKFDDDSVAFLSSLDNVQVRNGSKCIIDVSTNACVAARLYYSGGTGTVIKRGAGTLFLAAPSVGTADYYTTFIVEQGDLVFPQSGQALNEEYKHSGLVVSNGCRVVLDGGRATSAFKLSFRLSGFSGGGDIAYTNDSVACTLYAGGTDEPFTGTLSGDKLKLQVSGNLMLANNANTFACDNTDLYFSSGVLGFRKFGNKSATEASSLGKLNSKISVQGSSTNTFLCLATAADGAQSTGRVIGDANTGTISFDGGAYGNFTFQGALYSLIDVKRVKELVLTGSNTEVCSWDGDINGYNGGSNYGSYYLTKRGSGTWRLSALSDTSTKRAQLTGISVENGTLAFLSLAEQGTMCSLGYAPAELLYGYPYKGLTNDVPTVDYAIRLGNAADLTEEGCLEKRHTSVSAVVSCSTRPIAVTGRGRLRNGAPTDAFSWTGVKSVVPPEDATLVPELSTLTLDGSGTGANALNDVTENVGAAPLRIAKEGSATWSLGGTLAFTGGIDVREGTLNVGTMTSSLPYLRVDSGAALNLTGDAATASGFAVDASAGVGTISGVTFASAGTISVANVTALPVSIACDLSGCSGVENLSNWTVEQGNLSVSVSSSRIRISKSGFMVIFK